MRLSAGGVGCGVPEATDERFWLCGKGTAEFLPLIAEGGSETLRCKARLALPRARRRAKDNRPSAPWPADPGTSPQPRDPSGGATSCGRPTRSSAPRFRARTHAKVATEEGRARPPPAHGHSEQSSDTEAACAHARAASIRVTGGGEREGAGPAGGVGAQRAQGRATKEGAGPRRPRRAGRSRPMSGVHMPRRRREGRQRRINAIRAAAAEPSPTPPPPQFPPSLSGVQR